MDKHRNHAAEHEADAENHPWHENVLPPASLWVRRLDAVDRVRHRGERTASMPRRPKSTASEQRPDSPGGSGESVMVTNKLEPVVAEHRDKGIERVWARTAAGKRYFGREASARTLPPWSSRATTE